MAEWLVSAQMGAEQRAWATDGGHLFASSAWANVLEGLDCRTLFAWHPRRSLGVVVPLFRRGPVEVGFLGFPVAGELFDAMPRVELRALAQSLAQESGCWMMRATQSRLAAAAKDDVHVRPEVWISDPASWPGSRRKRIERDLAFAGRASATLSVIENSVDADAIHRLYAATVRGHGGQVRYAAEYFRRLARLAQGAAGVRIFQGVDERGHLQGFAVLARDASVAYYLHGAVAAEAKPLGLSDLLLHRLIDAARAEGVACITLMASPPDQPGLLRYKKKWADCEGVCVTTDVGGGPLGRMLAWGIARVARYRAGPNGGEK